jgi:glycerol-3-phosphate dehydrogenase
VLRAAGYDCERTTDVAGVDLAGCAKNAAALAAAAAGSSGGPNAAGAAAGKVFAEVEAFAARQGGRPETFAGLAGAGDLVATTLAEHSRNRRAGELLGAGVPARDIAPSLGHAVEAVDTVPLLSDAMRRSGVRAPAVDGLAALIEGRVEPDSWARALTAPAPQPRKAKAA